MPADVIIDPTNGQIYWNDGTGTPQSISIKGDALNAISFVGYSGAYSPGSAPGGAQTLATFNDSSTATLVPGTNNFELGSASLRWKFYGTTADFSSSIISGNLLSGAILVNGGIAISGNASIGQSLNLYGAGTAYTSFTGFKAGSVTSNTLYTLPLTYPATGTSVLQSDTSGVMSWVPMTATSASTAGTVFSGVVGQLAFYGATGNTVGGAAGVTYNQTTGILYNTHTTASLASTSGALVVTGGVGIGSSLNVGGRVGIGTNLLTSVVNISGTTNILGSTVITAPDDNTKALRILGFSSNTQGDIFSLEHPAGGSFTMASNFAGQAGGRFTITASGNAQVRGSTFVIQASDTKNVLVVDATSGAGGLSLTFGTSLYIYNSTNAQYAGFKYTGASSTLYTLPASDGSNGQFLQTNGTGTLTWATPSGGSGSGSSGVNAGGQYQIGYYASTGASIDGSATFTNNTSTGVVNINHGTISTSATTGALTVSGGVGIGGTLFVGGIGASISGVTISNSTINRGTWNGTIISTVYGGTGLNLTGSSGVLTVSSGTVSASTTSSAIASALTDETGSGSLVFGTTPTFTTSVVTGDSTFAVFNTNATTINAFGAATTLSIGANTGTATFNSTNNTTAANNGSVVFSGGVGIGKSVSIGGRILLFNGSTYTGFVSSQVGTGNTVYTLPSSSPATGSSVLQSTAEGIMSWVPMVASSSGAGNGTVAVPGAQYQIAAYYWSATGASVSGSSTFTNNLANNVVNISHNTASISTSSGALTISGGVGIGGSLFTATGSSSSVSGVILANGNVSASTYNKVTITAPTTSATLQLVDGSTLITSGANSLTLTTSGTTNATFPSGTKTLVATDVTSLASLTSASSLSTIGIITSGTWAGSQITAFYGGTGFSGYTNGDLLVGFGNTLAKLPASSNSGYVLTSTGAGSVPSWQSVPPAAASSVAVAPTTVNSQFSFTIVNTSSGTGLGLSTVASLVVNPSTGIVSLSGLAVTSTTQSTTSNTGALIVTGGAAIGQTLSVGGRLNIFNGANFSGLRFGGSTNIEYLLPPTAPSGVGASYLSASTSGVMAWVAAPTGGSATPGGSNKQIQYNSSNTFAGASGFEYTTGGIANTVSIFSASGTGYTAGLWIHAIDGSTTRVGIGLSNPAFELEINGEISATNKSFVIDHPTKSGMKLRYGSLEGPENGVYVRGELKGTNIIRVPDHWVGLVHPDSYTVHLTPIGRFSHLYVEKIENYNVFIADSMMCPIHCYYSVWAERKDIPKLVTEYEAQ